MNKLYKYYAFISYSHKDSEFAKWLQRELEHYNLPTTLNDRPGVPNSFRPVFRDEDELSGGNLKPQIIAALGKSAHLIVVCSPNSAQSKYVNAEIREFIEVGEDKGIDNRLNIYPIIISGAPYSEDMHTECFPEALKELNKDNIEPIAGDATKTGRNHAFVKVLAGTLRKYQIDFDELWNRFEREKQEQERKKRIRRRIVIGSLVFLLLAAIGLSFFFVNQNQTLQINQSRAVSEKVLKLLEEGDTYTATLLALEALPKNLNNPFDRPHTVEAEYALRVALDCKSSILTKYRYGFHISSHDWSSFSNDGSLILTTNDNHFYIWDSRNGELLSTDLSIREHFWHVSFCNNNKNIVYSSGKEICVWDLEEKHVQVPKKMQGHEGVINSLAVSPNGEDVLSSSEDSTVRVWSLKKLQQKGKSLKHKKGVRSAQYSRDGQLIITASDSTVRIWDSKKRIQIGAEIETGCSLSYVEFSPDGKRFLTVSSHCVRIWDTQTRDSICEIQKERTYFNHATFSPDGKHIATAMSDGSILLLDSKTMEQIGRPLVGHTKEVLHAKFSPDGKKIVSSSKDCTVRVWDIEDERIVWKVKKDKIGLYETSEISIANVCFSPDDKTIATYSADKTIRIWDTNTGKEMRRISYKSDNLPDLLFSPDGKLLIAYSWYDSVAQMWNVTSGDSIHTFPINNHSLGHNVAFSPDGKSLFCLVSDSTVQEWDMKTCTPIGNVKRFCSKHSDRVFSTLGSFISSDGKYIAKQEMLESGDARYPVTLWEIKTGKRIQKFMQCDVIRYPVAYNPKTKRFAFSPDDLLIEFYEPRTETRVGYINRAEDSDGTTLSLQFSPNGENIIVTHFLDSLSFIYNVKTGKLICNPYDGHSRYITCATFSNDGTKIATTYNDGSIHIRPFKPLQQLINETRERFKNRKLTQEERQKYYLE